MWRGVRERLGGEVLPPLTIAEVEEAEAAFGVRLPSEYRGFLLEVGAGGPGPAYGLFPLRRDGDGWSWEETDRPRTDTTRLSTPFTPDRTAPRPPPDRYDFEYYDDWVAADRAWRDLLWHPDRTAGAICLCDEGCLQRYWLAVSGQHRGGMWHDRRVDGIDLAPLRGAAGEPVRFGQWYLDWLESGPLTVRPS